MTHLLKAFPLASRLSVSGKLALQVSRHALSASNVRNMWEEHLSKNGPFQAKALNNLVEEGRDFAASHGIVMLAKNTDNPNIMNHAPFTLLPSPFPKYLFEEAKEVQKDFNILTHKIGQDFDYLKSSLER